MPGSHRKSHSNRLSGSFNKVFIEKICVSFLITGNALKDKFANNLISIKFFFSQVSFLFTFLDVQVHNKDSNYWIFLSQCHHYIPLHLMYLPIQKCQQKHWFILPSKKQAAGRLISVYCLCPMCIVNLFYYYPSFLCI